MGRDDEFSPSKPVKDLEGRKPVILSAAKNLGPGSVRFFAALRMTDDDLS